MAHKRTAHSAKLVSTAKKIAQPVTANAQIATSLWKQRIQDPYMQTNEYESQGYQLEYHYTTVWREHEMEVDGVIRKEKTTLTTIIRDKNQNNLGQSDVKQCTILHNRKPDFDNPPEDDSLQKWRGSGG